MLKTITQLAIFAAVIGSMLGYFGGETATEAVNVNTWIPWRDDVLRHFETIASSL